MLCVLFQFERALLYSQEGNQDILKQFGENCTTCREDHEENHHSVLTHFVDKHVAMIKAQHYIRASCLVKSVGTVKREMKNLFSNRKEDLQEEDVLFSRTDKESFRETNEAMDAFILLPLITCLNEIDEKELALRIQIFGGLESAQLSAFQAVFRD